MARERGRELGGRRGGRTTCDDTDVVDEARQRHQPRIDHHAVQQHVDIRVERAVAEPLEAAIAERAHVDTPSCSSRRDSVA
jgi:hypothetical protein